MSAAAAVRRNGEVHLLRDDLHIQGHSIGWNHRHLSNIDCLIVRTACLDYFISTVNGLAKKGGGCLGRYDASSGHTTKLKQSIFFRYRWLELVI